MDGNGSLDEVAHAVEDGRAVLRVCLAGGAVGQLPGLGMAEVLDVIDVEGDGIAEIVYGATTASAMSGLVAVWADGGLVGVVDEDGVPVQLAFGGSGTFDESLGWSEFSFWGCSDADEDGSPELVLGTGVRRGDAYDFDMTGYRLDGPTARAVASVRLRSPVPDPTSDDFAFACPTA